jgi:hypothetical protein
LPRRFPLNTLNLRTYWPKNAGRSGFFFAKSAVLPLLPADRPTSTFASGFLAAPGKLLGQHEYWRRPIDASKG